MSGNSEIERFQRWLQSELSLASDIEDPLERDRRQTQLEIAISETLRFRETVDSIGGPVAAPFVERESPVRNPTNHEVKPSVALGECHSCGAKKSDDIEFCPVCGEF